MRMLAVAVWKRPLKCTDPQPLLTACWLTRLHDRDSHHNCYGDLVILCVLYFPRNRLPVSAKITLKRNSLSKSSAFLQNHCSILCLATVRQSGRRCIVVGRSVM